MVVLGTETHVIEEIQLFEAAQPVDSLTISHSKVKRLSRFLHAAMSNPGGFSGRKRGHLLPVESPDSSFQHAAGGLGLGAVACLGFFVGIL